MVWKTHGLPLIASYFGITADMAKALRARPHFPLFLIEKCENAVQDSVFHGEWSSKNPRRWTCKKNADEDDYAFVNSKFQYSEITKKIGFDVKNPFYSNLLKIEPLFTDSFEIEKYPSNVILPNVPLRNVKVEKDALKISRQCYHLELDISGSGLRYQTGDHVGTWPENDPNEVESFASILGLDSMQMNTLYRLVPNPENPVSCTAKLPFNMPCSPRTAFTYYVDLRMGIKQYQMEV